MSDEIDTGEIENVQILPQDDEANRIVVETQVDAEDQADEQTDEQTEEQSAEQTAEQAEPEPDDSETAATAAATNNNNPKPILYNLNISPAVRCVKIVARLINLELELWYELI